MNDKLWIGRVNVCVVEKFYWNVKLNVYKHKRCIFI